MYFSAARNAEIGTLDDFRRIVRLVSSDIYGGNLIVNNDAHECNGRSFRATLRVNNSHEFGARLSWTGRHTVSASWEAYRDVLRAWFAEYPNSRVKTAMASYTGENFEATYPGTAYINIGSQMQPAYMRELSV